MTNYFLFCFVVLSIVPLADNFSTVMKDVELCSIIGQISEGCHYVIIAIEGQECYQRALEMLNFGLLSALAVEKITQWTLLNIDQRKK